MKDADGGAPWSWGCFCFSGKRWWNVAPNVLSVNFQRATKKGGSEPHSWGEEREGEGGVERRGSLVGLYQQTGYDTMLIQKRTQIALRHENNSIHFHSVQTTLLVSTWAIMVMNKLSYAHKHMSPKKIKQTHKRAWMLNRSINRQGTRN